MPSYDELMQNVYGTPAPTPTPAPAGGGGTEPGQGPGQPGNWWDSYKNVPWGNFGTADNWARQFTMEHGRPPSEGRDAADFWDSQMFAYEHGRAPSYGEWVNRWHTGDWNKSIPWQLKLQAGQRGSQYFGEPFTSERGNLPSEAFRRAATMPWGLPGWLQAGFVPWLQRQQGQQAAAPTKTVTPAARTPQAPAGVGPYQYQRAVGAGSTQVAPMGYGQPSLPFVPPKRYAGGPGEPPQLALRPQPGILGGVAKWLTSPAPGYLGHPETIPGDVYSWLSGGGRTAPSERLASPEFRPTEYAPPKLYTEQPWSKGISPEMAWATGNEQLEGWVPQRRGTQLWPPRGLSPTWLY